MAENTRHYDLIVIGAGSAGLSVSLFMNKVGLKVLLVDKTDAHIGGDCLNDGCVPSKALIHISRMVHDAKIAADFGIEMQGAVDMRKVTAYIKDKQDFIRRHENAAYFKDEGLDVILGTASFHSKDSISVNGIVYKGRRIVLATGLRPKKLDIPGMELVDQYDNESIFEIASIPKRLLVIGGGPIGIEICQAMSRLGSEVTVVHRGSMILTHELPEVAAILLEQLSKEGIRFLLNALPVKFNSSNEAMINQDGQHVPVHFDAVFVAIGRTAHLDALNLEAAGIETINNKIKTDRYLRTTNKRAYLCGDVAGDLQFSHAAEFHARILINNFFSPLKKRLDNRYMSRVTFTDPEIATFGLSETQLKNKNISFEKLEEDFKEDDRAVIDDYAYGKLILYIGKACIFGKKKILGGVMVAPHAGEMIQELILMNANRISIMKLFNKIYPYPVASRVNQSIIVKYKSAMLTKTLTKLLRKLYGI